MFADKSTLREAMLLFWDEDIAFLGHTKWSTKHSGNNQRGTVKDTRSQVFEAVSISNPAPLLSLSLRTQELIHKQAEDNLYHHRAPWWHCVPLMQLLEQRTKLQCVPLLSSRDRYSGFLQEFLHPSCNWIQGLKARIYSCFSWSLLSEAVTTVYTLIF